MKKTVIDLSMMLSENFSLGEFVRSATVEKYRIDNTPSWEHVLNLKNLCEQVLQPLRWHFDRPVIINSGYRSERLNEKVHGVGNSQHLRGEAADIRIPNLGVGLQMFDFIRDNCDFDQMLFESRRNAFGGRTYWLHVSCKRDKKLNRAMAIPNYRVGCNDEL